MKQTLKALYNKACAATGNEFDVIDELRPVWDHQVDIVLDGWVDFLTKNSGEKFLTTCYSEEPNYYGHRIKFAGEKLDRNEFSKINDLGYDFYFYELGMDCAISEIETREGILNLKDTISFPNLSHIKLLADPAELDESELYFGNPKIMSESDWDECYDQDYVFSGHTMWTECAGYQIASVWNILNAIHDELEEVRDALTDAEVTLLDSDADQKTLALYKISFQALTGDVLANVEAISNTINNLDLVDE